MLNDRQMNFLKERDHYRDQNNTQNASISFRSQRVGYLNKFFVTTGLRLDLGIIGRGIPLQTRRILNRIGGVRPGEKILRLK